MKYYPAQPILYRRVSDASCCNNSTHDFLRLSCNYFIVVNHGHLHVVATPLHVSHSLARKVRKCSGHSYHAKRTIRRSLLTQLRVRYIHMGRWAAIPLAYATPTLRKTYLVCDLMNEVVKSLFVSSQPFRDTTQVARDVSNSFTCILEL